MNKFFAILFLLSFTACNSNSGNKQAEVNEDTVATEVTSSVPVTPPVDTAHTTQNSVDWHGTYSGTLELNEKKENISITLKEDNTWSATVGSTGAESGNLKWLENGSVIDMEGVKNLPARFFVGENFIMQLEKNGHRIMDDLDGKYTLTKK